MVTTAVVLHIGSCSYCGGAWTVCTCGRPSPPPVLDHMEPESELEPENPYVAFIEEMGGE